MTRAHGSRGPVSLPFLLLGLMACALVPRAVAEEPPAGASLLIADFENGKIETVSGLTPAGISDEQMGGTSEARLSLIHPGAQGSRGALHIAFRLDSGSPYPFAWVSVFLGKEGLATDLTAYRGVRFYARSASPGAAFNAGVGQYTNYMGTSNMAAIEVKPEWTLIEVPFSKLQRVYPPPKEPTPFNSKDAISIDFSISSRLRGPFDLDIDQIELYK